jgi:phage tail sheath protein FI
MPVSPTFPGVYIEEIASGVRTITGVSTSVTAFIGYTPRGPVNSAVHIFNYSDYERNFGGLSRDSELGYAVQQFFLNGGSEAWIVRSASGATKALVTLCRPDGKKMLDLKASSEGTWANYLKVDVDFATTNPDASFNLSVSEYIPQGTVLALGRKEVFSNLSMDSKSSQYAPNVITGGSQLITAARNGDATTAILSLPAGWSRTDTSGVTFPMANGTRFVGLVVDGVGPVEVALFPDGSPATNLSDLVTKFQTQLASASIPVTVSSASGVLTLTSNTAPLTPALEHSAVRVVNASKNDAAKVLGLGLANRGREGGGAAGLRPGVSGTFGNEITSVSSIAATDELTMAVNDGATSLGTLSDVHLDPLLLPVTSVSDLAVKLQKALRAAAAASVTLAGNPAFTQVTVQTVGNRLQVLSGTGQTDAIVTFTNGSVGTLANMTGLTTGGGAEENVQRYSPGVGVDRADQVGASAGNNGTPPLPTDLIGDPGSKTGIYALEGVDIFNLLCIPLVATLDDTSAFAVISAAQAYCGARRAFYIIDPPSARNSPAAILDWASNHLSADTNSALYFPFVEMPDPLDGLRLNAFPPSGTVAGLYARIDSNRGVWKAPAGTEATLTNVQALTYNLTDAECGSLNVQGINCLRQFPVYGRVSWGARTMEGSDQQASEWKYIPVRRVALFLEESLFRGTQWVVFEPNDEPLWAQIRLNVGAFMQTLFRQGAFQGTTPTQAYFVKCDKETTTQDDINRGVVNILVGFAPLKPAEFVIIQIQQMAGQIQA